MQDFTNIYDKIYATDNSYNAKIDYKQDITLDWVKKNNLGEVLDVGCGRGHYLKMLSQNGIKVTGLEPSKVIANTLKDFEVINDDIIGLSKQGKRWPALICMDVLEHIEPEAIETTLLALSGLADYSLLGIANHNDKWQGTQLHLIQEKPDWWQQILSRYYNLQPLFESKRFFIFEAVS